MTSSQGAGNGSGPPGEVLLAVDGVTAGYGGGDILKGVSFTVARHEIMCIVGPNGSGKSTLLADDQRHPATAPRRDRVPAATRWSGWRRARCWPRASCWSRRPTACSER